MRRLSLLLAECFDRYDRYRSKLFSKNDMPMLSARQFHYLDAIRKMRRPNLGDMAEHFMISRPAVTKNIDNLEKMGYVKRISDASDRRIVKVSLTREGRDVLKINFNASEFMASEFEGRLDESELDYLKRILDKGMKK